MLKHYSYNKLLFFNNLIVLFSSVTFLLIVFFQIDLLHKPVARVQKNALVLHVSAILYFMNANCIFI